MRISNIRLIIYSVLLAMILSCCSRVPLPVKMQIPNPCATEDVSEFIIAMDATAKRFDDLVLLAEDTSPENLEPIIKEMQVVEQELKIVNVPSCALQAKAALDNYIFSKIQCYFHIYANETVEKDSLPESKIDVCNLALEQLEYYTTKIDALRDN